MKHFNLVVVSCILISLALGCSYLRPAQKLQSEAADQDPRRDVTDRAVALNNGDLGDLDHLDKLSDRINEVMNTRENNGVFIEGSNEIANTVFVAAPRALPLRQLSSLVLAINEKRGKAYLPRRSAASIQMPPDTARPNPLSLVVAVGQSSREWKPLYNYIGKERETLAVAPTFRTISSRNELNVSRVLTNSIEISADDRYFVNTAIPNLKIKSDGPIRVDQRPIDAAQLADQLPGIIGDEKVLRIIASDNASYESLLKVLDAAEKLNVDFEVMVREVGSVEPVRVCWAQKSPARGRASI